MLINLSELFPVEGKSKTYTVPLEMTHFKGSDCSYKIVEKEPVLLSRKLWDGDRLIMVTDGVLDALPGDDKEQVMGQFLDSLEEMPPQDMAEHVLDFALSFVPGARDDMTVLAVQVWKK